MMTDFMAIGRKPVELAAKPPSRLERFSIFMEILNHATS